MNQDDDETTLMCFRLVLDKKIKNMYFVNHDNLVPTFLDKPYKTCLLCSIASNILQNKNFLLTLQLINSKFTLVL